MSQVKSLSVKRLYELLVDYLVHQKNEGVDLNKVVEDQITILGFIHFVVESTWKHGKYRKDNK